ncbi:MAG: FAD-dependent oxidoreductase [Bacteroidales bacterium]|nr:FAD-dependent oxidoreductase [Bacteroidales bacterium]
MSNKKIVVIGGGPGGLETANALARLGYSVEVLEKEEVLGGHIRHWYKLFPNLKDADEVIDFLKERAKNPNITISMGEAMSEMTKNGNTFEIKTSKGRDITADVVIAATGFEAFKAERKEEFGYSVYNNVFTSVEIEEMLRSKGTVTTREGKVPQTVAIVHCVGSRDEKVGNFYCSRVCCICGVKQAIEIRKLLPDSQVFNYYMDMRMTGQYFEELYRESQEKWGVHYIRGRVSEASQTIDGMIQIKAEDTLLAKPVIKKVDMLILMVAIEASPSTAQIAKQFDIEYDYGFIRSRDRHNEDQYTPVDGMFAVGTAKGPQTLKETLADARATAEQVAEYLKTSSNE